LLEILADEDMQTLLGDGVDGSVITKDIVAIIAPV
jgi:hypothetical protein